jgi:flagellar basal-body rod protein FlgF
MIKGLYAAASAMLAGVNQQSVLAHNVANMDTPGFKQILLSLDDFLITPVVQPPEGLAADNRQSLVGSLGLGVQTGPQTIDFSEGPLQSTGQPLDLAIQGAGFFSIQTPNGERYTRDGRFSVDAENHLVTVDGYYVLDDAGQQITLPEGGELAVSGDGTLFVDGTQVARLGLAAFNDPQTELTKDLPNMYAANGQPTGTELGTVAQGYLEAANVNPAQLMTQMVQVARQYEAAQQMVQNQDQLLGQTIATLGRL